MLSLDPTTLHLLKLFTPLISAVSSTAIASYSFMLAPTLEGIAPHSPSLALRSIRPFFEGGKPVFPPLAITTGGAYILLALAEPHKQIGYGTAAAGCLGIIPFTALYMIPITNNRILDLDDTVKEGKGEVVDKKKGEEVLKLLKDFKRENWVRAGISFVGAVVGLYTILA